MPRNLQRADEIVGWLEDGKNYLVQTVRGEWLDSHGIADWPVVGPRHKDPDLGVTVSHYHIDLRFVPFDEFKRNQNTVVNESCGMPIRYKKWTCLQACVVLTNVTTRDGTEALKQYIGKRCSGSAKVGWTCPHRGVWLGSQPALKGVITCPGHGLRIDSKTGRVLPSVSQKPPPPGQSPMSGPAKPGPENGGNGP